MKFRAIKIHLFYSTNLVFWDCTPQKIAKFLRKKYSRFDKGFIDFIDGYDDSCEGCNFSDKFGNNVIWLSNSPRKRPDLIAHEAVHAGQHILDHWNIDSRNDSGETLAAIVSHIVSETLA